MTLDEMLSVIQAYKDGEKIQYRKHCVGEWNDCDKPSWNFGISEYRVKPKKKYRPYENVDEMVDDFVKRFDSNVNYKCGAAPIWLKTKTTCDNGNEVNSFSGSVVDIWSALCFMGYTLDDIFNTFDYMDGSPVGRLVN